MKSQILKYKEQDKVYREDINARYGREKDRFEQNYENKNLYSYDAVAGSIRKLYAEKARERYKDPNMMEF
jgi:hypothetical protein